MGLGKRRPAEPERDEAPRRHPGERGGADGRGFHSRTGCSLAPGRLAPAPYLIEVDDLCRDAIACPDSGPRGWGQGPPKPRAYRSPRRSSASNGNRVRGAVCEPVLWSTLGGVGYAVQGRAGAKAFATALGALSPAELTRTRRARGVVPRRCLQSISSAVALTGKCGLLALAVSIWSTPTPPNGQLLPVAPRRTDLAAATVTT